MKAKPDIRELEDSFNSYLSIPYELVLFILGFIGLTLFATLFQLIFLRCGIPYNGEDPSSVESVYFNVLVNFSTYLALLISAIATVGPKLFRPFIRQLKKWRNFTDGLVFFAILIFGSAIIGNITNAIGTAAGLDMSVNENESLIRLSILNQPILSLFFVVLFAPFFEELVYRVGLFGMLKKTDTRLAFVVSILVFALIHFSFTAVGDDMLIELLNLPSYLFAGGVLCYAYYYKGSFVTSWTTHLLNNLMSYVVIISRLGETVE